MGYLHTIITQFFRYQTPPDLTKRVHERIATADEQMLDDSLLQIWNQIPTLSGDIEKVSSAFAEVEHRIGTTQRRHASSDHSYNLFKIGKLICAASLLTGAYLVCRQVMSKQVMAMPQLVEHYVERGAEELILLPDSTKVYLCAGSSLIHAENMDGDKREVFLRGEGYFEVHKDAQHPFVVKTHGLSLEVLGTQFNLAAYPETDCVVTTLTEGKVMVKVQSRTDSLFLLPGDQLTYWTKSGDIQQQCLEHIDANAWRNHDLQFDNYTLNESFNLLERRFNISIRPDENLPLGNRLNVHFHRNESLQQILDVIGNLIPGLEYKIQGQNVHVSYKKNGQKGTRKG